MAKVTGPLFSLDARGTVGESITYSIWKGINYVRRRVVPENPQTALQQAIRQSFSDAVLNWQSLSAGDKALWDAAAPDGMSGFNYHNRVYITQREAGSDPQDQPS